MSEAVVNFSSPFGQFLPSPKLFQAETMADAVADVIERKAPGARRKYVEKHFGMNADDARRVVEGRASKAQLDKMFKVGGWGFVLEVFAVLLNQGVDQHLAREASRYEQDAERLRAITRDLRPFARPGGVDPVGVGLSDHRLARAGGGGMGQGRTRPSEG